MSIIQILTATINETKPLVSPNPGSIQNFAELKKVAFNDELKDALTDIEVMLNSVPKEVLKNPRSLATHLQTAFIDLLHKRHDRIKNSALDIDAAPFSATNELYWKVDTLLFGEQPFVERLKRFMPEIHLVYEPLQQKCISLSNSTHLFSSTETSPLHFEHCLFQGNLAFYVPSIERCSVTQHIRLYEDLSETNLQLLDALKEYNVEFSALYRDIEAANGKTITLRSRILHYLPHLKIMGTTHTGNTLTSFENGSIAHQFVREMNLLDPRIKKQLYRLSGGKFNKTFGEVVQHLEERQCTDMAAIDLQGILNNPDNTNSIIDLEISLGKGEVEENYRNLHATGLVIAREEQHKALPISRKIALYKALSVTNLETLRDVLLAFPPEEYDNILKYANINLRYTGATSMSILYEMLNEVQVASLRKAEIYLQFRSFCLGTHRSDLYEERLKQYEHEFCQFIGTSDLIKIAIQRNKYFVSVVKNFPAEYQNAFIACNALSHLVQYAQVPEDINVFLRIFSLENTLKLLIHTSEDMPQSAMQIALSLLSSGSGIQRKNAQLVLEAIKNIPNEMKIRALLSRNHSGEMTVFSTLFSCQTLSEAPSFIASLFQWIPPELRSGTIQCLNNDFHGLTEEERARFDEVLFNIDFSKAIASVCGPNGLDFKTLSNFYDAFLKSLRKRVHQHGSTLAPFLSAVNILMSMRDSDILDIINPMLSENVKQGLMLIQAALLSGNTFYIASIKNKVSADHFQKALTQRCYGKTLFHWAAEYGKLTIVRQQFNEAPPRNFMHALTIERENIVTLAIKHKTNIDNVIAAFQFYTEIEWKDLLKQRNRNNEHQIIALLQRKDSAELLSRLVNIARERSTKLSLYYYIIDSASTLQHYNIAAHLLMHLLDEFPSELNVYFNATVCDAPLTSLYILEAFTPEKQKQYLEQCPEEILEKIARPNFFKPAVENNQLTFWLTLCSTLNEEALLAFFVDPKAPETFMTWLLDQENFKPFWEQVSDRLKSSILEAMASQGRLYKNFSVKDRSKRFQENLSLFVRSYTDKVQLTRIFLSKVSGKPSESAYHTIYERVSSIADDAGYGIDHNNNRVTVYNGMIDYIRMCIDYHQIQGALVNTQAINQPTKKLLSLLYSPKFLLSHAALKEKNHDGDTILHTAFLKNPTLAVEILLILSQQHHDAYSFVLDTLLSIKNQYNITPLDILKSNPDNTKALMLGLLKAKQWRLVTALLEKLDNTQKTALFSDNSCFKQFPYIITSQDFTQGLISVLQQSKPFIEKDNFQEYLRVLRERLNPSNKEALLSSYLPLCDFKSQRAQLKHTPLSGLFKNDSEASPTFLKLYRDLRTQDTREKHHCFAFFNRDTKLRTANKLISNYEGTNPTQKLTFWETRASKQGLLGKLDRAHQDYLTDLKARKVRESFNQEPNPNHHLAMIMLANHRRRR